MKNPILKYGIYSTLVILTLFGLTRLIWGNNMDYTIAERLGYLSILIALSFVFFGIKAYRDEVGEGYIQFSIGLKVGSIISLFPSAAFFIYTALLFLFQGEEFMTRMYQNVPEEQLAQFEANKELYLNPLFQGGVMFATVFLIGFVIALISSWILLRRKQQH